MVRAEGDFDGLLVTASASASVRVCFFECFYGCRVGSNDDCVGLGWWRALFLEGR